MVLQQWQKADGGNGMNETLISTLEYLLHTKFGDDAYKKYKLPEMKEAAIKELNEYAENNKGSPDYLLTNKLIRGIKKLQSEAEVLLLISDKYFSLQGMDA